MQPDIITTRIATPGDVRKLIAWAEQEGWNPGVEDADMFFAADDSGFFVTCLNDVPVAGVSLVKQNAEHAFLGLYLCKPEFRGNGYGLRAWNAGLESIGERCVGLDGVVQQQENYKRSGFAYLHRNVRYSGSLSTIDSDSPGYETTIRLAGINDLDRITEYDGSIGGLQRREFYNAWLAQNNSRVINLALHNQHIVGIIGLRRCKTGYKVGPWLADNPAIAMTLLASLEQTTHNEPVMIDVPEPNYSSVEILKSLSFSPIFETARMYRGEAPLIDIQRLLGVATFELG